MNVIIVTGLSGAGKTQAMNCLEDLEYYCVDNMPPALMKNFIQLVNTEVNQIEKVAFAIDIRGGVFFADIERALNSLEENGIRYKILYLEASDSVLIRRFNETRRQHPLFKGENISEGLRKEALMLKDLRDHADYIVDTSNMNNARLWQEIKDLIVSGKSEKTFVINIMSFGYKKGIPLGADMVFDVRFIPNPYYVKSLRALTGNNQKVRDYIFRYEEASHFIQTIDQLMGDLLPCYMREGKYSLNLAFGCTGGQHRSVAVANEVARVLKEQRKRITIEHRDL